LIELLLSEITGTAQVGINESGISEIGSTQVGFTEISPNAQISPAEVGISEIGSTQVGSSQVGVMEVSTTKVGVMEVNDCSRWRFRGLGVRGLQEIIARQPMERRTPRGALVGMASKVKMRPLIRCGVNHGLRALISCSFSCPLQCHKTMPELTS